MIGNVDGVLAIFKGRASKPLKKCSGLGTVSNYRRLILCTIAVCVPIVFHFLQITCIGIGDLFNTGKVSPSVKCIVNG